MRGLQGAPLPTRLKKKGHVTRNRAANDLKHEKISKIKKKRTRKKKTKGKNKTFILEVALRPSGVLLV